MNDPIPARPAQRFWRHPLTQMFARILFFALVAAAIGAALRLMMPLPKLEGPQQELAETGLTPWLRLLRSMLSVGGAYWLMVRLLERRKVDELAPRALPMHIPVGWVLGTAIMVTTATVLGAVGYFRVKGVSADPTLLTPLLVLGIGPGFGEEIVARGILFRVVEEASGTWFAMLLSAALFGLAHYGNPNATAWSSAAIAIEAGLLLAMAFAWSRSLWFVMALHAAWNFTQGPLLGIAVSGIAIKGSLLESTLTGPPMLSGGEFGAEGSVLTVLLCVSLSAWFTHRAIALGRIVPPFWRRRLDDGSYVPVRFAPTLLRKPLAVGA